MVEPPELSHLTSAEKDALIVAQAETIARLTKRIEELEAKLGAPPKTPDNSSLPPSRGRKASGEAAMKPKGTPHRGSHRALHPNPTRTLDVRAERWGASLYADIRSVLETARRRAIDPLSAIRMTLSGEALPAPA